MSCPRCGKIQDMQSSTNQTEEGDVDGLATATKYAGSQSSGMKTIQLVIPECCRGNWDSCKHKLKDPPKRDQNPI